MSYHIAREGKQLGTFTEEEVLEGLESGKILPTDELWTEGMEEWQPVEEVIEPHEDAEHENVKAPADEEEEPDDALVVDFEEGKETQSVTPLAPIKPRPDPALLTYVEPASVAAPVVAAPAAQPQVVYRPVAPSLLPGQYGTAGSAIASMVLGILSLVTCFVTGVPAIICGHLARGKIRRSGGVYSGDGLAVAGMILGYVTSTLAVLWIGLLLAGVNVPPSQMMQGWGRERQVRGEGHELALALKHYASAHAGRYPANLGLLVQEHLVDQARLGQLQKTELGDSWKGPPGWQYMAAGAEDSDAGSAPLLISHARDGGGRHLVIYQDASADKAEIRSK